MKGLITKFDSIPTPTGGVDLVSTFGGVQILDMPAWHICKDHQGKPAFLVSIDRDSDSRILANVSLENLRIEHGIQCRVSSIAGAEIEGRFTILRCLASERVLHEYFLLTMGTTISSLPATMSSQDLSNAINTLVELFHSLAQAPTRPVHGLWAELFVMLQSADPIAMIEAWHSENDERFDFSSGQQRLEVKSSGDRTRRHFFSFEQAYPPEGTDVLVASVFIERLTNGTSLGNLWDEAKEIVKSDHKLLMKIERICLKALGNFWVDARTKCFDLQIAEQSLSFYRIHDIPRVAADLPHGISEVKFRSDLSFAAPVDIARYCVTGTFFDALFCD